MFSVIQRAQLFLVSYAPLCAIFAARVPPHKWWPVGWTYLPFIVWLVLAAIGILQGVRLMRGAQKKGATELRVTDVREEGAAVAGYLATYLLPFLGAFPKGLGDYVAYLIYFGVLFVVFVRSDFGVVNPTLYLFGRRVVRATRLRHRPGDESATFEEEILIVCKHLPRIGATVSATLLAGCWVTKIEVGETSGGGEGD